MRGPLRLTDEHSAVTNVGEVKAFLSSITPLKKAGILDQASSLADSRRMLGNLAKWKTSMAGLLANAALRDPDRIGLIDDEGQRTYTELLEDSHAFAETLRRQGIDHTSTVAVMCRNGRGILYPLFAKALLGYRIMLLNAWGSGPQLQATLEREGADALIIDGEFIGHVDGDWPEHHGVSVYVAATHSLPEGAELPVGADTLAAAVDRNRGARITKTPKRLSDTVVMSSGTHGIPKGVVLREPKTPKVVGGILRAIPWRRNMVIQLTASMFHAWGWLNVNLCVATRSTMIARRVYDPEQAYDDLVKYKANGIVSAAVFLQGLEDEAKRRDPEMEEEFQVEFIVTSGNAIHPDLVRALNHRFGEVVCNFYCSTELGQIAIANAAEFARFPRMAGRVPSGVLLRILNEQGEDCPEGEVGGVYSVNGMSFSGYTNPNERIHTRAGLVNTGDVGYFDHTGRLFLKGRSDDMAIIGGENVYPRTVEEVIAKLPQVGEVFVTKRDDAQTVQALVAYVVLCEGHEAGDAEAESIREQVRQNLAEHSVPKDIHFKTSLPRNDSGKVVPRLL